MQSGTDGRVEQTYKNTGLTVGTIVQRQPGHAVGQRVLVPVTKGFDGGLQVSYFEVQVDSDGLYRCMAGSTESPSIGGAGPLTPAQYAEAMTRSSIEACTSSLAAIDPAWKDLTAACGPQPMMPSEPMTPSTNGCGLSATGSEASVGLLVALVSSIIWRRLSARAAPRSAPRASR